MDVANPTPSGSSSSRSNNMNGKVSNGGLTVSEQQRVSDSSRLTFRAGPLSKPVARSYNSSGQASVLSSMDTRHLLKDADVMRKELGRKEARNTALMSEMQVLRTSYSSLQRELRMLSGTFEKVNADRQRISHELVKCKDYKDKLEAQLARLGDVQHLTSQADRFQAERDQMEMEMGNFRSLLAAREDRVKTMERELEVFHRALDVQAQYEGGGTLSSGAGTSSLSMKSLYYELGKRQTDAHSLAISLASSNQELVALKDSLRDAIEARAEALSDLETLRSHCSKVTQQNVRDKDALVGLQEQYEGLRGLSTRLQGQVEDLSKRLAEERMSAEKRKGELEQQAVEDADSLARAQAEIKSLRARVEFLQKSLSQTEQLRTMTEKRLASEWTKLSLEMETMAEKSQRFDLLDHQLADTQNKLKEAESAKESALATAHGLQEAEALQLANAALAAEVDQARARAQELLGEKEQSVAALQQTMDAAREVNARYHAEKTKRTTAEERLAAAEERASQAERLADSLNRAREHVSTAVLDALAKEKAKTAVLERTIQELQSSGPSISAQVDFTSSRLPQPPPPVGSQQPAAENFLFRTPAPGGFGGEASSSPEPTVRPPLDSDAANLGSSSISDELDRLRAEIMRMEAAVPHNISGIATGGNNDESVIMQRDSLSD